MKLHKADIYTDDRRTLQTQLVQKELIDFSENTFLFQLKFDDPTSISNEDRLEVSMAMAEFDKGVTQTVVEVPCVRQAID